MFHVDSIPDDNIQNIWIIWFMENIPEFRIIHIGGLDFLNYFLGFIYMISDAQLVYEN